MEGTKIKMIIRSFYVHFWPTQANASLW